MPGLYCAHATHAKRRPRHASMTNEKHESGDQIANPLAGRCAVVGRGRMGHALASALRRAAVAVQGPLARGATGEGATVVILCVSDREIAAASALIAPGRLVAHVSASAPMTLLEPHEHFVLHPLLSVTGNGARFEGATCAINGSTAHAIDVASALSTQLGMRPRFIEPAHRPLYHAAASAASNFVTTTLGMAEQLAAGVGLHREELLPLVQSAVDHWAEQGARAALTGPIARGDVDTVVMQERAVSASAPELLPLWRALAEGTRELARSAPPGA